jgi:YD repeat-containing protein
MPKRKNEFDYDNYPLPPLPDEYEQDAGVKKRRGGCVFLLVLAFAALALAGYFIFRSSPVAHTEPTPTFPPDDEITAQVDGGLQEILVSASGQVLGGGTLPVVIDTSIGVNSLAALDNLAYPEGAFFDPEGGQLVVFGPPAKTGAHPASDDFLIALLSVYNQTPLAVSIDPTGDPDSQNVRYEGPTESTHFGWVMFEADRRMKTLSMGQDNLTNQPVSVIVPGYANLLDLELASSAQTQGDVRRRFWFTAPLVEIEQTPDGRGMLISNLSLVVETEYLDANWQTMTSQPPDPAGEAFASHLSDHLGGYASEIPIFAELDSLARWTALAHWLYQSDLPFDSELFLAAVPVVYETPETTPAITVSRQSQQGNVIQTLTVWGGVDLGMEIKVKSASQSTKSSLESLTEKFKARFAGVEEFSSDQQFASISPVSLDQQTISRIRLPLPHLPTLEYDSSGKWQIQPPRLDGCGASAGGCYIFKDLTDSPVALLYGGKDTATGADIFINRDAGYWMSKTDSEFKLLRGEFLPDGQFSYQPEQDATFNADGQMTRDTFSGTTMDYEYSSGRLVWIRDGAAEVEITYAGDELREIRSAGSSVEFEYQNHSLSEIVVNGETFERFEYEQGRLTREINGSGQVIRQVKYDLQGRVLFQSANEQGVLYDWRPGGFLRLYSGPSLFPWQEAENQDLEELKVALRLSNHPKINRLLFVRQVGDKVVALVGERSFTMPAYLLQNPVQLRRKLKAALGEVGEGETVLISSGNITNVSFQSLFPKALPITIEKMDEARVWKNLQNLDKIPDFTPESASIVNGVPLPTELGNVGLDMSKAPLWEGWKQKIEEVIRRFDFSSLEGSGQIQVTMQNKGSVMVIVAHGNEQRIYLPDGTSFSPDELNDGQKRAIAEKHPFVILLSCNTATITEDQSSFSQRLLDAGAVLVVAPNGNLPVDAASEILGKFLENAKTMDPIQAILNAILSVYPDGLIPSGDGEHFFEFLTKNPFDTAEATHEYSELL